MTGTKRYGITTKATVRHPNYKLTEDQVKEIEAKCLELNTPHFVNSYDNKSGFTLKLTKSTKDFEAKSKGDKKRILKSSKREKTPETEDESFNDELLEKINQAYEESRFHGEFEDLEESRQDSVRLANKTLNELGARFDDYNGNFNQNFAKVTLHEISEKFTEEEIRKKFFQKKNLPQPIKQKEKIKREKGQHKATFVSKINLLNGTV